MAEMLTTHPAVLAAVNQIVAACGQLCASVQRPFLTVCDAAMGYHLPACLRLLEAAHIPEILREAGPRGLHVNEISRRVGQLLRANRSRKGNPEDGEEGRYEGATAESEDSQELRLDPSLLSHVLRLLATHHITREVRPDVFANNRISGAIDSGRTVTELGQTPETKYDGTNGIAAFVGLWCASDIGASRRREKSREDTAADHPMHAPFNLAFRTRVPYFEWLETPENAGRLKRFGRAMTGTGSWEVPGAIVGGFPWHTLPPSSLVVDVGGGIGSTSLLLAHAFPRLRLLIQDRPQVVKMGETAWKERCPELLESGRAAFQSHNFFAPQPPLPDAMRDTVFLLRVITHDWPDAYVKRILLHLRQAAGPNTKLLLADYVLPLACLDEDPDPDSPCQDCGMEGKMKAPPLPGTVRSLAPEGSPLLPNLGKANANAYWLDLTMRVTFNAQERTLRELTALAQSVGWKIVRVTRAGSGSLFGHLIAEPVDIPAESLGLLETPLPGMLQTNKEQSKHTTARVDTCDQP
ncbi:S-adenosyl-L-methionine-dependent methyltransferase [Wolfiporia cocos MD-104 SS10]|uniref:S-adenosyl-L-methionine-dependent methyltransferase n=1 Tax=Wolfiporia cocos (strain MD-104) TaxID=742152 RepID=A0A2H3JSY2_WOLCO|nr:S-adenosyl-L-methionine-dependent methyltransferase [Wolfiporia cocos MD-104 SS10]